MTEDAMSPEYIKNGSILHVEDVYHGYGGKVILENVDLTMSKGAFLTVVGPSGCGKSTFLRIVIGEEFPQRGTVLLHGMQLTTPDRRRGIVYQQYSLFRHLTVIDNVLAGSYLRRWPWQRLPSERYDRAYEFLKRAGMGGHEKKYPSQLSGGQRQRVAIVQSILNSPDILCMDEPFSALDPSTREEMQMFLLELWEETGMTILFVTHDLEEGVYLGTRLIAFSRYYTDDRGNDIDRGARIKLDLPLSQRALGPSVKETPEFQEIIRYVRDHAFDPRYVQHVRDFELLHPSSWNTLTNDEDVHGMTEG